MTHNAKIRLRNNYNETCIWILLSQNTIHGHTYMHLITFNINKYNYAKHAHAKQAYIITQYI